MYRVHLTEAQREELRHRTRVPGLMPRTRDRLEMVRLSDAGFSIPRIAVHLGICEKRVRHWIKTFLTGGFDALPDRPHLGQHSALTPKMEEGIRQQMRKEPRTWTAAQVADWLAQQFGVGLTPDYLARRLKRAQIAYKRTGRSLHHKQDSEQVSKKKTERQEQAKRGTPGRST